MKSQNDQDLLKRFAESGDESAFRTLADRYSGLVFGTARRHSANHQMAEDATQKVFTILARKANALCAHPTLGGWLFRSAFYEATKAMRAESTRRGKHEQWGEQEEVNATHEPPVPIETVAALDEALANLSTKERELVVMRYFRCASFVEIGVSLGISENAGQKRTGRVLEKLARALERKGVGLGGATLATVLASGVGESASAAPAGLAASVTQQAMGATAGIAQTLQPVLWGHLKIAAFVVAGTALAPVGHHWATSGSRAAGSSDQAPIVAMPSALSSKPSYDLAVDPLFGGTEDPAERMRRILELEDWGRQRAEIRFLVGQLPAKDLPVALAVLTERQPEESIHIVAFIESWAERDPGAAIAFIGTRSVAFAPKYWSALVKGWAQTSPTDCWRYLSAQPADAANIERINMWLSEVCLIDGTMALELMATAPDRIRREHLNALFYNWPSSQTDAALDAIAKLGSDEWSRYAIEALFAAPGNEVDASWLKNIEERFGVGAREKVDMTLYEHWFKRDPIAAMEHVRALADPKARDRAIEGLRRSGAESHFQEQFEFNAEMGAGHLQKYLIRRWIKNEPEDAEAFVLSLPPDQQAAHAEAMGAHFSQRAPDRAMQWAEQLGDAKVRGAFRRHFLRDLVERDFDASMRMLEQIDSPELVQDLSGEIADAYARRDPAAAMSWALETIEPAHAGEATRAAMQHWAKSDLAAASEWFDQQEPGATRDAAAKGLAEALHQRGDRAGAMDLYVEMGADLDHAFTKAQVVVTEWVDRDARGFRAWLGKQPPEVQAELRRGDGSWAWLVEDGE